MLKSLLNLSTINQDRYNMLIKVVSVVCISTGIYKAWKDLDEYENTECNKTLYKKIERSCVAFTYGTFGYGPIYCLIFPIAIPGGVITGTHFLYSKYIKKE